MQPAPQLAGYGSNSPKVVCGLAEALFRTLLHSIARASTGGGSGIPGFEHGLCHTVCVTLGKLLNLYMLWFPYLKNLDNYSAYLTEPL